MQNIIKGFWDLQYLNLLLNVAELSIYHVSWPGDSKIPPLSH